MRPPVAFGIRSMACLAALFTVASGLVGAAPAEAGIRVVEDEVIFTLEAPGAERVFLVGDFNNWNPTVERMPRKEGDVFEVQLFMVEGEYRYKFVVDGTWIVDPDNPGADPQRGSPFTLVETPGGMALRTEEPVVEKGPPPLVPSLRYIVVATTDREDSEVDHIVDVGFRVRRSKLTSAFILQTDDASWQSSPAWFELAVRRGFVATELGPVNVRAFENDSVWTSRDPFGLVGDAGLYAYNAGYGRTGAAAEYGLSESIRLRGLVADRSGTRAAPPRLDAAAVSAFASGTAADTTVYRFDESVADGDVLALEGFVDAPDFIAGYARRHNEGVHAGLLAQLSRADTTVAATLFDTRERWRCDVYWLRLKKLFGFEVGGSYGGGRAEIVKTNREEVDPTTTLRPTTAATVVDETVDLLESNRLVIDVARRVGPFRLSALWDRARFEFDADTGGGGEATVDRAGVDGHATWGAWRAGASVRYTNADYGTTPAELHIDDPTRNFWLDERDNLTVAHIAALDEPEYTVAAVFAEMARDSARAQRSWAPSAGRLGIESVFVSGTAQFLAVRLGLERDLPWRLFVAADGRAARYEKLAASTTFTTGYIEAGYRWASVDVTVGFGLDPVVFDPVLNEYADIGRSEFLRQALPGRLTRNDAGAVGEALLQLERELEAFSVIKLECIVRF